MFNYTTKMEVNLRDSKTIATDIHNLTSFLIKSKIPALVVSPTFIEPVLIERSKFGGGYKIITTVDFGACGKNYALAKVNNLPRAAFSSDGMEFHLTPKRTDKECLNELKVLTQWAHQINPMMEIRWVFAFRTHEYSDFAYFMPYLKHHGAAFIRPDTNLEVPNLTIDKHVADISYIKQFCGLPIKISGNVNLETMQTLKAARFDVSVSQAKKIVKDIAAEMAAPTKKLEVVTPQKAEPVAAKVEVAVVKPEDKEEAEIATILAASRKGKNR